MTAGRQIVVAVFTLNFFGSVFEEGEVEPGAEDEEDGEVEAVEEEEEDTAIGTVGTLIGSGGILLWKNSGKCDKSVRGLIHGVHGRGRRGMGGATQFDGKYLIFSPNNSSKKVGRASTI